MIDTKGLNLMKNIELGLKKPEYMPSKRKPREEMGRRSHKSMDPPMSKMFEAEKAKCEAKIVKVFAKEDIQILGIEIEAEQS